MLGLRLLSKLFKNGRRSLDYSRKKSTLLQRMACRKFIQAGSGALEISAGWWDEYNDVQNLSQFEVIDIHPDPSLEISNSQILICCLENKAKTNLN